MAQAARSKISFIRRIIDRDPLRAAARRSVRRLPEVRPCITTNIPGPPGRAFALQRIRIGVLPLEIETLPPEIERLPPEVEIRGFRLASLGARGE